MKINSTEFYTTPQGVVMYHQPNSPIKELHQTDRIIVTEMLDIIRERYPKAFEKLCEIYTINSCNRIFYEFNIVCRFIKCNFGEYDSLSSDIDSSGHFNFEEVHCPLRGECKYEGSICRPELNTSLTEREIEVLASISEGLDSYQISEELNIAPTTVNRHRENIKVKLGLKNISQLVKYYIENLKSKK